MGQELTDGERALLPEVQWVPEGPVLQDDPVVPAMRENCARELAQYPYSGMGLCGAMQWLSFEIYRSHNTKVLKTKTGHTQFTNSSSV